MCEEEVINLEFERAYLEDVGRKKESDEDWMIWYRG